MSPVKFKPQTKVAFDKVPLELKVSPGVREKVMAIPGWQETVRAFLEEIIPAKEKPDQIKQD